MNNRQTALSVENLYKRFGTLEVLKVLSVSAHQGDVITMVDITGAAGIIHQRSCSPCEATPTVTVFYMALTFMPVFLLKKLAERWFAHLRPQTTPNAPTEV